MRRKLVIYDTTLRDGTQREGISLSCDDKLRIAQRLDALGVAYIEGGWPGSNPKDVDFFNRAGELTLENAKITAFGSTCRVGSSPGEDPSIQAMVNANTPVCTVVGKSWNLHVEEVLKTDAQENLRIIKESVSYLKRVGREVIYDAEHFFDGYKTDPDYALDTLRAAQNGGADSIVICDTNGGALPWEVAQITQLVVAAFPDIPIGIHSHNDGDCGVANTLAAVQQGAVHVQGTINGYGERCGNANLCSVIPDLELKMDYQCLPEGHLPELFDLSHFVAEVANLAPDDHMPFVGHSAFAHKGGIHVAAMRRNGNSYQHIDPTLVGNQMRTVVSELSGRGNLFSKAEELNLDVQDGEVVTTVLEEIKALEARGFSFEAAEASVALMLHRQQTDYQPLFELIDYSASVEHRQGRGVFAEATVKVMVDKEMLHTVAEGNGPVNALDAALRKALLPVYPRLGSFQLVDYKVRILDSDSGTAATTRVLIDTQNHHKRWSTVGASPNIIEASWLALVDSIEFGLSLA
jgi:2-isopropylmalate synthase